MEEMILINSFDMELAFGVLRIDSRNRKSHHGSHLTQGTLTLLISGRAVSLSAVFPQDPGLATAPAFHLFNGSSLLQDEGSFFK